jgi:hypothetical protein
MMKLERDEEQVGHDQQPENPPGRGRRHACEGRGRMTLARAPFLKRREPEQQDNQQRDGREERRIDEHSGHDGQTYSKYSAAAHFETGFLFRDEKEHDAIKFSQESDGQGLRRPVGASCPQESIANLATVPSAMTLSRESSTGFRWFSPTRRVSTPLDEAFIQPL